MRRIRATLERDEDGVWCGRAELGKKFFAYSDGPTIERSTKRLHEAVAAGLDCDVAEVELDLEVKLPEAAQAAVDDAKAAKEKLEAARVAVEKASASAARTLERHGLSRRDAGSLLGVTRQRVSQFDSVSRSKSASAMRPVAKKRKKAAG